jgi:hypothetical protein
LEQPQLEEGRKITEGEFTIAASKIVRSIECGVFLDSDEAYDDADLQDNSSILEKQCQICNL